MTLNTYPGSVDYTWDFGDGSSADTSANPIHAYTGAGNYTVSLIAGNSSGTAFDTASMLITIISCNTDSIYASFFLAEDTLCADEPIAFINSSVAAVTGSVMWSWDFGDGTAIDTSENPLHVFVDPGFYYITLIASNASGTEADTFQYQVNIIDCTTGISAAWSASAIEIFPNPAENILCIRRELTPSSSLQFELMNMQQQVVIKQSWINSDRQVCISPLTLPAGIYYAKLKTGEGLWVRKVMIE